MEKNINPIYPFRYLNNLPFLSYLYVNILNGSHFETDYLIKLILYFKLGLYIDVFRAKFQLNRSNRSRDINYLVKQIKTVDSW